MRAGHVEARYLAEDETAVFELGGEEDDAPVKWFKDGKEIIPDGKRSELRKSCKAQTLYFETFPGSKLLLRARRGN